MINHTTPSLSDFITFRLEFNEERRCFHMNNGTHPENTNGWMTICQRGEDRFLMNFITYMDKKYPGKRKVKLKTVMAEFKQFSNGYARCVFPIKNGQLRLLTSEEVGQLCMEVTNGKLGHDWSRRRLKPIKFGRRNLYAYLEVIQMIDYEIQEVVEKAYHEIIKSAADEFENTKV